MTQIDFVRMGISDKAAGTFAFLAKVRPLEHTRLDAPRTIIFHDPGPCLISFRQGNRVGMA